MKTRCLLFLTVSLLVQNFCFAQSSGKKPYRLFLTTGFGAAGNFFVRSYEENLPFPSQGYYAFLKKNFLGTSQEISAGIHLRNNLDLKVEYHYQRFSRHVQLQDTLSGVVLSLDHHIHHVNNIWTGGMAKNYFKGSNQFVFGLGLFFIRPSQQEVEIYPNFYINRERRRLDDLGTYVELGYECKFQPKVNLGIKGQFFWILSGSYPESIALLPYIRLNL